MSFALRARKFAAHTGAFVLHFAHGGIVVAGLLAIGFLTLHAADGLSLGGGKLQAAAVSDEDDGASAEESASPIKVSTDMRGVVDYLARRYKVSTVGIEPLVSAAKEVGSRVGLDPLLILSVMAVESSFNPIAESVMGAQGLMQVIPRFHREKLEDADNKGELLDPIRNIQVGALVLKESIRRAGSLERGLQQYAGASSDSESQYAEKVVSVKRQLEQALRRPKQQVREV